MKSLLQATGIGLGVCLLLFASSITTGLLIQQGGTPQGSVGTLNCTTGVNCSVAGGIATVTTNGGTISGLTAGCIPEAATATTLTNSTVCDNGTILTVTGRSIHLPGGGVNSGASGVATGTYSLTGKTSGNNVVITVADATAAGTLTAPGATGSLDYVSTPGTSGHCAQFTSNGIGLADGGSNCTGLGFRGVGSTFNGGGSALTAGAVNYFFVPFACTISAWNATVDTGTITFDVWKVASGTAIPTVTNSIVASANPAIASGTALHSTTLTGWTTTVLKNDIFAFQIKTTSGPTNASLVLECDQ